MFYFYISIHVPSWGTTGAVTYKRICTEISIHVPSWGTTKQQAQAEQEKVFQSTFPRGERQWFRDGVNAVVQFQSTFPRGERQVFKDVPFSFHLFQSTFPRGERRHLRSGFLRHTNFNPRSLVGNDGQRIISLSKFFHFNPRSLVGNDIDFLKYLWSPQ